MRHLPFSAEPRHRPRAYVAALDGIRAIAIIAVYIYHLHPGALRGGFTGVDVFYVLSGYLITGIILQDLSSDRFSLVEFYTRRIQRLLPNVVLTVAVTLMVWTAVMLPSQVAQAARHGLWALFNLSNIYTWLHLGDYWSDTAEWAPLTHTWSLGVEEQFYLLYPAILLGLVRARPRRLRLWLSVGAAASFGTCVVMTRTNPVAAFYLLPTRFWELLLGGIVAAWQSSPLATRTEPGIPATTAGARWSPFGLLGLALVFTGFVAIDSGRDFPGWTSLAPTVGTAMLLIGVTEGENRVGRWLGSPLLVYIGKLSYSLYLWHWPAIILGRYLATSHGLSPALGTAAGGIGGVAMAWLAYVLVEQPLRRRGPGRGWRLATVAAGFASSVVLVLSLSQRGRTRPDTMAFPQPSFYGKLYDADLRTSGNPTEAIRYADVYFPPMAPRPDALWKTGGVLHRYGGDRPQVVVLGSSHALMYSKLVDDICRERSLSVAFLGAGGKALFFGDTSSPTAPDPFDAARRRFLRAWRPDIIFAIDRWDARFDPPGFAPRLREFLAEVCPLARRVVFVAQIPVLEIGENENLREAVVQSMKSSAGGLMPRLAPDSGEARRREAVGIAESMRREFPCLRVLRVDRLFYHDDGSVRYAEGMKFYYADDDHLADLGSVRARSLFDMAIAEASGRGEARPTAAAVDH